MATLKIEMNTDNFMAAFGKSEFVRSFSPEAIEMILEKIGDDQDEGMTGTCWTAYFMEAGEVSATDLVNDNKHKIGDHAEAIIDMARGLDIDPSTEVGAILEDSELSDTDIINIHFDDLVVYDMFIDGVAEILADDMNAKELSNGKYLTSN